jgi:tyrosyl-tRNA synthetase
MELGEIAELCKHRDERMNGAKKVLAYEITKLIHGEAAAAEAQRAAEAAFSGGAAANMVTVEIGPETATVIDLLVAAGAAASKSNARQLIEGGGVSVDDEVVRDVKALIPDKKEFILHKGKKTHVRIVRNV